jgi:pimeloyl-ACP methyl ester carboxylesterase
MTCRPSTPSTPPPPVRRLHDRGLYVRVRDAAAPAAPARTTVCWIHGLGESGLCFEHLLRRPELADRRHLVPDLPGYGRSLWRDEPPGLVALADLLADWLRRAGGPAGPGPFTVVGHSMGGVLGLLLAERHPDLVARFVDVDGNKSPGDCVFSGQAAARDLADFTAGGFDDLRDAVYRTGLSSPAERGYHASMLLCDPRAFHLNSRELVAMSRPEDMAARTARLPMPAHYIAGVPDGACARTRELLDAAGVPWTGIEPSGHWPFIDRPDDFLAALRSLLD